MVLDGRVAAPAGNGGKAGAFSLDIATLGDFAGFNQRLNDAGFYRSRQFRIRQGDVTLDGATTVEDFGLTADHGRVNITGRIDARAAYGGAIRVTGGNGVSMQDGAQLLAGATGTLGSGRVTLEATGGSLDLRGGTIDVAGADGGKVRLRARQNATHDDLAAVAVKTGIVGARSAVLEGVAVYENQTSVDAIKSTAIAEARSGLLAVERAMRGLPHRHQAIFMGLRIHELTRDEVAARHGLSLRRVDTTLRQALAHCAQSLR